MIVCHCLGATDRDIRLALEAGRCTLGEVGKACGAGVRCGGCVETIREILAERAGAAAARGEPELRVRAAGVDVEPRDRPAA